MADEDLAAIEARMAAALPGPWQHFFHRRDGRWIIHNGDDAANIITAESEADADFVAHAWQDIKVLIEEVRIHRAHLAQEQAGNAPTLGNTTDVRP